MKRRLILVVLFALLATAGLAQQFGVDYQLYDIKWAFSGTEYAGGPKAAAGDAWAAVTGVLWNTSEYTFAKVGIWVSIIRYADGETVKQTTAYGENVLPGDKWRWTALPKIYIQGEVGRNLAQIYYGRVDRVVIIPAKK